MTLCSEEAKKLYAKLGGQLFRFIDCEQFTQMIGFMEYRSWKKGELLWNEGDPYHYMATIVSGKIEIMKETDFKGNRLIVGIMEPGAIVGGLSLFDGETRTVTAVALEDSCLLTISKRQLEQLIEEKPVLGVQLMKGMVIAVSERLKHAYRRLIEVL